MITGLFSSSSLSAIMVDLYFIQPSVLHDVLCISLKQTDNIQPWHTPFPIFTVHCSMSGSNCCLLTCIHVLQEGGKVVWYSQHLKKFPHYVVIHTAKEFSIVSEAVSSVQFSCSVVYDSLGPHELQHARLPCPTSIPRVHSNSGASSRWCHPAISPSVIPFSSCSQSLPASESFPVSQLFTWGGQNKVLEFQL